MARRSSRVVAWTLTAGWVGLVGASVAYTPDAGEPGGLECSDTSPCLPEPALPLFLTLLVAGTVWLHRVPALALPALSAATFVEVTRDAALPYYPVWFLPVWGLVTALTIWYTLAAVRGRSAQRRLAVAASNGVLRPWPGPDPRRPWANRWVVRTAAAAVGAVLALGYGQTQVWQYDEHARTAERVSGTVLGHFEDDLVLRVRLPDRAEVELDTLDAAGYPLYSKITVLVDGDWHALAAEPYDPFLPYLFGCLLLAVGLSYAVVEWRLRRGLEALRRPQPVLGVLVGIDGNGRTAVWAADAAVTDPPLFVIDTAPIGHDEIDGDEEAEPVGDEEIDEGIDERDPGVLHGPAYDGGAVAIEVGPAGGEPLLLLPARLIRPAR